LRANAVGTDIDAIAVLRAGVADGLTGRVSMPDDWPELALLAPAKDYPSRHAAILLPFDALLAAAQDMKLAS